MRKNVSTEEYPFYRYRGSLEEEYEAFFWFLKLDCPIKN